VQQVYVHSNLGRLSVVPQQHAVGPEHVASLVRKELDLVQVSGDVVGAVVELERLAAVSRHVHGAAAAHSPNFLVVFPAEVNDPVAAGLDVDLVELGGFVVDVELGPAELQEAAVEGHPQAFLQAVFDEPHGLDAPRGGAVVRDPKVGLVQPGEEEVATRAVKEPTKVQPTEYSSKHGGGSGIGELEVREEGI